MNRTLHLSAIFSKLTYKEFPYQTIKQQYAVALQYIKTPPIFFSNEEHDTQANIFRCDKELYIAFRGTESKKDVIADLKFRKELFISAKNKEKVHRGFQGQLIAIETPLFKQIQDLDPQYEKIIFTGHSLGGALATIASLKYVVEYQGDPEKVHCITYGSPRVGNGSFTKLFNKTVKNVIRFTNWNDPVTIVPPLLFAYRHVCQPTYLLDNRLIEPSENRNMITTLFLRIAEMVVKTVVSIFTKIRCPTKAHSMSLYCNRIEHFYSIPNGTDES